METNVVVVVMVGLPGSGKTTLCRALKTHYDQLSHDTLTLFHVCYDDLIPLALQREFVERKRCEGEVNGAEWKGTREKGGIREVNVRGNRKEKDNDENDKEDEESKREGKETVISEREKDNEKEVNVKGNDSNKKNARKDKKDEGIKSDREKKEGKSEREKEGEREVNVRRDTNKEKNAEENEESERQVIGEDWKSARQNIHNQVDQLIQRVTTDMTETGTKEFFGIPLDTLPSGGKYVILLDDNFYYRSMRYEFFQLARRHSAAFCQLYVECSVEEAARNNGMREEGVPLGVVTAMGERLQVPQPHLHPWEANSCVVKGGVEQVCQAWDVVVQSFHRGLTPLQDREEEVAEARRRCSQSVVHQADLCLRVMVKCLVKEGLVQAGDTGRPASQVAAGINAARQAVLAGLRGGALEVPSCLADTITQGNRQEFEAFLLHEMKERLPK